VILLKERIGQVSFSSFEPIARTITIHYKNTLNYFDNRSTSAFAETFGVKIKAYRG